MKRNVRTFERAALDLLLSYDWPGNVRELENVIERAVILCRGEEITASLLPLRPPRAALSTSATPTDLIPLDEVERRHIGVVLKETGFHKSRSAEILGISRKTLDRKIVEYGIEA
jgi:two-component system response regulator HydG